MNDCILTKENVLGGKYLFDVEFTKDLGNTNYTPTSKLWKKGREFEQKLKNLGEWEELYTDSMDGEIYFTYATGKLTFKQLVRLVRLLKKQRYQLSINQFFCNSMDRTFTLTPEEGRKIVKWAKEVGK